MITNTYTAKVTVPTLPMDQEMMSLMLRWLQQFDLTPHQAEHLMVIIRSRVVKTETLR